MTLKCPQIKVVPPLIGKPTIGFLPKTEDINTSGLTISDDAMEELVLVDNQKWLDEMAGIREYFEEYEERLPEKLLEEHAKVIEALNAG